MDREQAKRASELMDEYGLDSTSPYELRARVRLLACLEIEMGKFQRFVNQHGPTYVVRGKSGDTYSRARPEYQQLQEARHKYAVLLDRLSAGQNPDDTADGFLAP